MIPCNLNTSFRPQRFPGSVTVVACKIRSGSTSLYMKLITTQSRGAPKRLWDLYSLLTEVLKYNACAILKSHSVTQLKKEQTGDEGIYFPDPTGHKLHGLTSRRFSVLIPHQQSHVRQWRIRDGSWDINVRHVTVKSQIFSWLVRTWKSTSQTTYRGVLKKQ